MDYIKKEHSYFKAFVQDEDIGKFFANAKVRVVEKPGWDLGG